MPSLHVISGCNAVCTFHGIRKSTWLSTIQKKEECLDALRLLGETLEVDNGIFNTIERLVYHLYGKQTEHRISNAQYKKFSQGKTPNPQQLSPTHNQLQSYVWKQALLANSDIPSPSGHGWLLRDDLLKIQ